VNEQSWEMWENMPFLLKKPMLCGDRKYLTFLATCQEFFRKFKIEMSIESAIEKRIEDAIAHSEFDNLRGTANLSILTLVSTPQMTSEWHSRC
jgi:hypothetical protein